MSIAAAATTDRGAARCIRVLALVTDAGPLPGGIAAYNRDFVRGCAAHRAVASVEVVARRAGPGPGAGPRVRVRPPRPGRAAYVLECLRAGAGPRFDVVFCGHLAMAPLAAGVARLGRAALWVQLHGIEAWSRPAAAVRHAARRADLALAVSRCTRRRFLEWSGLDPHRARVLPNTVDERFGPGPRPAALARDLGAVDRTVLLTVGRLAAAERYKGHDRILDALPAVRARIPDLLYVIAGDGDDRERLEAAAHARGLDDCVRFVGHWPADRLPALYRLADAFAMPSTGEGFGIVLLEAAACGTPVVAGDRDGARDALRDGAGGWLVDPGDAQALAAALHAALRAGRRDAGGIAVFRREHFERHLHRLLDTLPGAGAGAA